MTAVSALRYADEMLVTFCQVGNNIPGFILASVVNEHDSAFCGYLPLGGKLIKLPKEHRGRNRQNFLLIVARYNNIKFR